MNDKDFFVILTTQNGGGVPLELAETMVGEMVWFATEKEACEAAESTHFGEQYGYEVFERGMGNIQR